MRFRLLKIILVSLFYLIATQVSAATYYVRDDGNDSNTGLSDDQAWATIDHVNGFSFSTGDDVYLKCDDEWFPATDARLLIDWGGTSEDRVIIGAYYGDGTIGVSGNKPIIDGQCDPSHTGVECGTEDFWTGKTPGNGNDALVEINDAGGSNVQDYVTIENLRVENSAAIGIRVNGNGDDPWTRAQNVIIQYCDVNWIATSGIFGWRTEDSFIQYNHVWETDVAQRYEWSPDGIYPNWGFILGFTQSNLNATIKGNHAHDGGGEGIGSYINGTGVTIEENVLYNNGKSGIYISSTTTPIIRYNLVYADPDSLWNTRNPDWESRCIQIGAEEAYQPTNAAVYGNVLARCRYGLRLGMNVDWDGFKFYNNTIVGSYYPLSFYTGSGLSKTGYVRNNIIAYTDGSGEPANKEGTPEPDNLGITFSHNCWGGADTTVTDWAEGTGDVYEDCLTSKTTGWDDLEDGTVIGSEFELQPDSPCIGGGTPLGPPYNTILRPGACNFAASPIEVDTALQGDHGNDEIGAFVYRVTVPVLLGVGGNIGKN